MKGAYCNFSHEPSASENKPTQPASISGRGWEGCWSCPSPQPPLYGTQYSNINYSTGIQWGHEVQPYHTTSQPPPPQPPDTRRCNVCLRHLTREHFSHSQWQGNRANKRPGHRCRTCITGRGVGAFIQFPIDDKDETFRKLSSNGRIPAKKERTEGTSWAEELVLGPAEDCPSLALRQMKMSEPGSQKDFFGECIYRYVLRKWPVVDAGKITGMLLDLDERELCHLLDDSKAVDAKVEEALQLLEGCRARGE